MGQALRHDHDLSVFAALAGAKNYCEISDRAGDLPAVLLETTAQAVAARVRRHWASKKQDPLGA